MEKQFAAAPVSNRSSASSWFGTVPRPVHGPQQTDSGDFNTVTEKEEEKEEEDSFTEKEIQEAQPRTASDTAEKTCPERIKTGWTHSVLHIERNGVYHTDSTSYNRN